jgi:hypothetical protein
MSNTNQNDDIIEFLCGSVFDLQGHLKANSILLNSLMSIVCENAPELIQKIIEKTNDVAELSVKMGELRTDFAVEAFKKEINQSIKLFALMEESSKYSDTYIEIKKK